MGLFKKKRDPVAERAEALNQQIAALEAQILQLSEEQPSAPPPPARPAPAQAPAVSAIPAPAGSPFRPTPQPRLRSTAKPHGLNVPAAVPAPPSRPTEPIFEEVNHTRLQEQQEQATSETFSDLGVRQHDLGALWRRLIGHFRGPATNNPKLVNYLAAGSIQGLRPMRYEKRVARNRFLILVIILVLALWGIIAVFLKKT